MRAITLIVGFSVATIGLAAQAGPYKILEQQKVGGGGGFDYVNADSTARRLYVARRPDQSTNEPARIMVYNLDTLAQEGEIPDVSAHGVAIDPKTGHGFASSKPITEFDAKTLKTIKTIDVQGNPDGLLFDPFDGRVHVLSHSAPHDTVINAADGTVVGTIDLGGGPEEAASDGKGTIYVDLEDKSAIAVVDAKAMKLKATYDISSTCEGPSGLGFDAKNGILFATCHAGGNGTDQPTMTIVSAKDGKILKSVPIGRGTDGGGFNPATMEAFSSNGQSGTLSIVKESSPTSFDVEQELKTVEGGNYKTMTIDAKTNRIVLIGAAFGAPSTPPAQPPAAGRGRGPRRALVPGSFSILVVGR